MFLDYLDFLNHAFINLLTYIGTTENIQQIRIAIYPISKKRPDKKNTLPFKIIHLK